MRLSIRDQDVHPHLIGLLRGDIDETQRGKETG